YLRFCESRGMEGPELSALRPPKVKAKLPKILTMEEFDRLMVACETEDPARTLRNRITLLLLYGVGSRVSELIGLDLMDFNATDRWVRIVGKGNKERIVPLTDHLAEEV